MGDASHYQARYLRISWKQYSAASPTSSHKLGLRAIFAEDFPMHSRAIPAISLSLLLAASLLSGCGMGTPGASSAAGAAVQGHIMGGQQPVAGSTIQLYA